MKICLFHNKRKERKAELPSKWTGGGSGLPTIERNLAMNPFLNPFICSSAIRTLYAGFF